MIATIARLMSAMGLALGLGVAFLPIGCGSSPKRGSGTFDSGSVGPEAPEETVARLKDCAVEGAADLTDTHYAILLDVDVTESGAVREAKVRDSLIPDHGMERCMVRVLEDMPVPLSVMAKLVSLQPVSPASRGYVGDVLVLGGAVSLVPIVLVAVGVTIVVVVTVQVAEEAVEAIKRWPKKINDACDLPFHQCLDNKRQPEWNRGTYGDHKDCLGCLWECRKDKGRWPDKKCPPPDYRPN